MTSGRWRITVSVAATLFLLLAGTTTAHAQWTAASVALPATVSSASVGVRLAGSTSLTNQYRYAGSVSPAVIAPLSVENTGGAPLTMLLTVTGSAEPLASATRLQLWAASASGCGASVPAAALSGTLAAPPPLPAALTPLPARTTVTLCAATTLTYPLSAVQGASGSPTLTLTGTVGSWSASTAGTFTQSVYRVAAPGAITCSNHGSANVRLSWTTVPSATGYLIVLAANGATVPGSQAGISGTTYTITVSPEDLGSWLATPPTTGSATLRVQSVDSAVGSTSLPSEITIQHRPGPSGTTPSLRCV